MENNRFLIIVLILVVSFIGLFAYTKTSAPSAAESKGSNNIFGKLDSSVTLTEYVDFQCEACYVYYPTVKEIKEKYKDRVKFQIKNFPISNTHKFARMSASYAEAAALQGKYFEMHDKIYEGQKIWEQSSDPEKLFEGYAKDLGLDISKLNTDRVSPQVSAIINADLKEVKKIGGTGTPTFAINGKKITNPENTVDAFTKVLDEALKNAQ